MQIDCSIIAVLRVSSRRCGSSLKNTPARMAPSMLFSVAVRPAPDHEPIAQPGGHCPAQPARLRLQPGQPALPRPRQLVRGRCGARRRHQQAAPPNPGGPHLDTADAAPAPIRSAARAGRQQLPRLRARDRAAIYADVDAQRPRMAARRASSRVMSLGQPPSACVARARCASRRALRTLSSRRSIPRLS